MKNLPQIIVIAAAIVAVTDVPAWSAETAPADGRVDTAIAQDATVATGNPIVIRNAIGPLPGRPHK